MQVEMVGGPAPYREAVSARLGERGHGTDGVDPSGGDGRFVAVVYCDHDEAWTVLEERATDPACVAVAVVPALLLELYIRALVVGASGVVYVDTSSTVTADAIEAAIGGEVILPRQAAQSMAALARRERPSTQLDDHERQLLSAVATGRTVVGLARELHYSERTVRRHLQSLYLKLGVKNRAEAIASAARLGLLE